MGLSDPIPGDNSPRGHINERVDFPEPFVQVPEVTAAISYVDHDHNANLRLNLYVGEIDTTGFNYAFATWANTRIYGAKFQWMAVAK